MSLRLGHGGAKRVPWSMLDYMRRRFHVPPEELEALWCFEFPATVKDKKVRRFRIYSPARAQQEKVRITEVADLDKHHYMLLFEGYIDTEGKVYVADRRIPPHTMRR